MQSILSYMIEVTSLPFPLLTLTVVQCDVYSWLLEDDDFLWVWLFGVVPFGLCLLTSQQAHVFWFPFSPILVDVHTNMRNWKNKTTKQEKTKIHKYMIP